jgi:hypothetical protein
MIKNNNIQPLAGIGSLPVMVGETAESSGIFLHY